MIRSRDRVWWAAEESDLDALEEHTGFAARADGLPVLVSKSSDAPQHRSVCRSREGVTPSLIGYNTQQS